MSDDLSAAFAESVAEAPAVEVETVEQEAEPTSEPEEKSEAQEEEKPEPKEEKVEYSDREKAYLAEAKDERRKRQEAVKRLEELEAQLAKNKEPEKRPDIFEDQDKYTESILSEVKQEVTKARFELAEEMMRDRFSDYDEIRELVVEKLKDNPALMAELQKSSNIPKAVYDYGKKFRELDEIKASDGEALRAKIREEERAKLQKELEDSKAEEAKADNLSPSLANVRGSTVQSEPEVTELADVFDD